jgi:hypothetical protein
MRTFWRLAFHILRVAIIEWDRLFPVMKLFPVMAQILGMGIHSVSVKISATHILPYPREIASKIYRFSSPPSGRAGVMLVAICKTMW